MISLVPNTTIVAAVQTKPIILDVNKNLASALQLTYEAAGKGAAVVVLPELCTSGFNIHNVREASDVAQDRNGYQTEAFLPIAQKFNCHIIFGYVELCEGNLYNSAAVVGPNGLEANTQKKNLWGSDNLWAQPSEVLSPVVITRAGRTGVLICRDAMNHFRESYTFNNPGHKFYNKGSIDTIALLASWSGDYAYPDNAWVELVEETRSNLIVANRVGKDRDIHFKGGSCIIDRDRRIWTHGSNFKDEAVVGGVIVT